MKAYPVPVVRSEGNPHFFFCMDGTLRRVLKRWAIQFIRQNGILLATLALFVVWSLGISAVTARRVEKEVTERLSAQYAAEYEARMNAYISQQEAIERVLGDGSMQAQMEREADAIAQVIGKMKTKRMKLSETWNILMRVDSPFYANTVEEVVSVPGQWMFFESDGKNPIRDDDRALVLEQVKLWHEGRYPAGLTTDFVYGEWSENDYVLRNKWEKDSTTEYWRFPE